MSFVRLHKERIFGLDLMRAIAILAVLGSHILYIFPDQRGGIIPLLHLGGVMGVELFFVLSGYLIGTMLFKLYTNPDFKRSDLSHFLVRRWFRTLPNYYLVLILNIILVLIIGRSLPDNWLSYFVFLQNFNSTMDVFFTESWSLPIEEMAYLLGPLVLICLYYVFAKAKKEHLFLIATLSIITVFMITKIIYNAKLSDFSMSQWNEGLKAVTIYRIDAIFYGVLAAYISMKCTDFWKKNATILLILGFVLFLGFQFYIGTYNLSPLKAPFLWNVVYLPFNSICFCLLLPFLSEWRKAPKLIGKPITILSIISYAIYLLHYGLILQTMRWIWPIEELSFSSRLGYTAIYFVVLIGISLAWYRIYEKPMTDLRDKPFIRNYFNRPTRR